MWSTWELGGSNNKNAAGKNPRCPLSFLFFALFQDTCDIDVFVPNLVKNVSSKITERNMIFNFFVLFLFFLVVFAGFG